MNTVLDALRGGLVVSCQAYPGEPMLDPNTMAQVAQAVVAGGAVGVRGKGLDDLRAMRPVVDVPIIGLVKVGDTGVYITPTLADCLEVAATGCEVVALDGTRRPRPDGLTLAETIVGLRAEYPEVLVMADCGSVDDAEAALAAGADILGTTLAGYTGERDTTDGPDWEVVDGMVALAAASGTPVLVEGRVHTTAQAAEAVRRGAWAVVVGTAITHPTSITRWFAEAVRG
ncbi:N-acetylmannosamine-6-phosphate 2-epimerase [Propioniciclava sp. MC1595]|uniref:N-acetylmannosamine-6-phosphate 2-epimerase n=1 Tax=Propioniciclava sp. MC1595 TaxID=2760308 RepID=UPI0016627221|nr:N-acetylmannosamine-6-phosphate 2-epimerase [Propioniciclava sp. MC1595]MBB1495041.1 N-acetylmannosamine-6-phosphate 2-epimerase [Propioniciclava sp. MC1595]QTE26258.1 N-acetylmannosamine-6-phosphate 2-epimerase [Propioniciclava sp. MC1595]